MVNKMKIDQALLEKYAQLAIQTGLNVQKGQYVLIQASTEANYFARLCVAQAYAAGARSVSVQWNDDQVSRLSYLNEDVEELETIADWTLNRLQHLMDHNYARLVIVSSPPGVMAGVDPEKLQRAMMAQQKEAVIKAFRQYSMANTAQWSIVAVPSEEWAKIVFPDSTTPQEDLFKAILKACRVDGESNPLTRWQLHNEQLHAQNETLNKYNFKTLHFTNSLGTDIHVGLIKNHHWAGGSEKALNDVVFNPNMPTEESFTMPDPRRVDGIVYASMPLAYSGRLVEDFWVKFKDGKVVDYDAKAHREVLTEIVETDDGSGRLGEIALISHHSPISEMGILFYNTLFDENASCHMALGAAYPMNLKDSKNMSQEQLVEAGMNVSGQHVDFMFGTPDLKIVGETYDGQYVHVFEEGNFVLK